MTTRIEECASQNADIVTARALAQLDKLLEYAAPHLTKNGRCLFLKGKTWKEELTAARQSWHMVATDHKSTTDPSAALIEIEAPIRV